MSKILLTKKTSAIFLATVLVIGIIAISSPLTVYGQQYEQDYSHNYQQDYESSYYPSEPPVMDDSQSVKPSQKANCDNKNVNINDIDQRQSQNQLVGSTLASGADEGITGQELTPEEALDAITGTGDPLVNIDRNILNVCFNGNDNTLTGLFSANQDQTGTPVPPTITCEECFEEILGPVTLPILNEVLATGQLTITIGGESITPRSLTELCEALQDATGFEIFNALSSFAGSITPDLVFCLGAAFGVDTTGVQ